MDERRRYFRIEDVVVVRMTPVSPEDKLRTEQAMSAQAPWPIAVGPALLPATNDFVAEAIAELKTHDPLVYRAMSLLYTQLQSSIPPTTQSPLPWAGLQAERVNLSATGLAVHRAELWPIGQSVVVECVLFPDETYWYATATVVDHRPHADCNMALDFDFVPAGFKDRLIRHVLRKQVGVLSQSHEQQEMA